MVEFHKAVRSKAKARIGLSGPSGSGKTYSALILAKELGKKIAVIDTENSSASLYANEFNFDTCIISAPYTPKKYVEAIHAAEAAGYDVIVIDSLTHAWAGTGGALDMVNAVQSSQKNQYAAWRSVTPEHNKLVDALIQSKAHIIATMRAKHEYEQYEENGRRGVRRIGMAPIMRDGIEYEFTLFGEISIPDHLTTFSKDRTTIFGGPIPTKISPLHGQALVEWLNSGIEEKASVVELADTGVSKAPEAIPCEGSSPSAGTNTAAVHEALDGVVSEAEKSIFTKTHWAKLAAARKATGDELGYEIPDEELTKFGQVRFGKGSKTEWTMEEYEQCLAWLRAMYKQKYWLPYDKDGGNG